MSYFPMHMMMSEAVNDFHWFIYFVSILAFMLLLTRWRSYGAAWIAALFIVQIIFRGCPITDVYNYLRIQEGLHPGPNGLLTAPLSGSYPVQMILSVAIVIAAVAIIVLDRFPPPVSPKKGSRAQMGDMLG